MAKKKAPKKTYTADEIMACIQNRYGSSRKGWESSVVFEQLPNGTGGGVSRRIDAVVFDLWPSSGLTRRAIEIKVTRQDFLRELETPEKHAWARACFHEFWFAAPASVIKEEELPDGVGWMKPRGQTMAIVRAARRQDEPEMDDLLLAAVARYAARAAHVAEKHGEQRVLATSETHSNAMAVCRVVDAFLESRDRSGCMIGKHVISADSTKATLREELEKATADAKATKNRKHALTCLDRFRGEMRSLFRVFAQVAHVGLMEADEAGRHVVQAWGGMDEGTWQEIVRRAREKRSIGDEPLLLAALSQLTGLPAPGEKAEAAGARS